MNDAYLSLGSNDGDRNGWLKKALNLISANCGAIVSQSLIYETAAWGITDQPDFLNMAVRIQTQLPALELLDTVLGIELQLGRERVIKWGPRIIDIDILLFNNEIINEPGLIVPHPFLHKRRFTLAPLADIAAEYIHPVLSIPIVLLLANCDDELEVVRKGSLDEI